MTLWDPAPDYLEERFGTLGTRAKKRHGTQTGENSYLVFGDPKLGDAFDNYNVTWEDRYVCSCQNHKGGQYRSLCSHICYVILAKAGSVSFEGEWVPPKPTHESGFQNLPALPIFVDQGQEWNEGVREVLDTHFGSNPPLPDWVKFLHPHQWDAYCNILYQFDGGKKVVFLSAPTGSGKTLIGELVRRSFARPRINAIYTCTTKTLQNQFSNDFPYAKVIKGRSNYSTLNYPNATWLACDLCEKKGREDNCQYCYDTFACPYVVARDQAERDFAVANVAYLLSEGNTPHSRFAGRQLVIMDEADSIEDELMRHIEISISPRTQKQLGLNPPDKKTVADAWQPWVVNEALPKIRLALSKMGGKDPKDVRQRTFLERLRDKLEVINLDDSWVYTGYDAGYITFKPIKVDQMAPGILWSLGDRWLLMSATIISAQQMAEDLGLNDDEWATVDVESTFPPENRPIYIEPVANMTAKTKDTAWPTMLERINQIIEWHGQERILVHSVSYDLSKYLVAGLGPRALTYSSASERESILEKFRASANGVLVAPSFERGIDLPYDQCRVIVVAKVPFPYLGDKQISKRLYSRGGQGWYAMQTVRSLVQMTGRAMRHADDSCESYLLDSQFVSNIWKKQRHILPEWWKQSLVMRGSPNRAALRGGDTTTT